MYCTEINENQYQDAAGLALVFSELSAHTNAVSLSGHKLHLLDSKAIASALSELPEQVTSVELSNQALRNLTPEAIVTIFSGLPKHVTSIDLSGNNLGRLTPETLATILSSLPKHIVSVNLNRNGLTLITPALLSMALSKLPIAVTSVDFSLNGFCSLTCQARATALSGLPKHVTSIRLNQSGLCNLDLNQLATVFSGLPEHIISIELTHSNILFHNSAQAFTIVLSELPKHITSIGLSHNALSNLPVETVRAAFSTLPKHLTSIDLSHNNLYSLTPDALITMLSGLPKNVRSVNLSWNAFSLNPTLLAYFSKLPTHIQFIGLKYNGLLDAPIKEAHHRLTTLTAPATGRYLELSHNGLSLVSCVLPVFLNLYKQGGWHHKGLPLEIMEHILGYLIRKPSHAISRQKSTLSFFAIKYIQSTLVAMPNHDFLVYLDTQPPICSLESVKQQLNRLIMPTESNKAAINEIWMKRVALINLFLEITKIREHALHLPHEKRLTVRKILHNMSQQAILFMSGSSKETKQKAKIAFNQDLDALTSAIKLTDQLVKAATPLDLMNAPPRAISSLPNIVPKKPRAPQTDRLLRPKGPLLPKVNQTRSIFRIPKKPDAPQSPRLPRP